MANPSKARGTDLEVLLENYYKQFWPTAHRLTLSGKNDRGDIGGMPLHIEAKNSPRYLDLPGWTKEAKREAENVGQPFIPVVHKRVGTRDPALQWATLENWMLVDLLLAYERDVRG